MGQGSSRELFVTMLKTMLKVRGVTVAKHKLEKFLLFVEEVCPWFPEDGTVNIETWKKVGEQIQQYYSLHGAEKVLLDAYSLWALIRDCLDPEHESKKLETALKHIIGKPPTLPTAPPLEHGSDTAEKRPVQSSSDSDSELDPAEQAEDPWELFAAEKNAVKTQTELSPFSEVKELLTTMTKRLDTLNLKLFSQPLCPSNQLPSQPPSVIAGLDPPRADMQKGSEAPTQALSVKNTSELFPLQLAIRQARQQGETLAGFPILFPVREDAQQRRYYEPLPFKQIKELKQACAQYGPTAPFTMSIIENLNSQYLPPNDWKQVSRACLSGGDYLLWKSEFGEQCGIFADRNRRNGLQVSFEMLMGEGAYRAANQQLNYPPAG